MKESIRLVKRARLLRIISIVFASIVTIYVLYLLIDGEDILRLYEIMVVNILVFLCLFGNSKLAEVLVDARDHQLATRQGAAESEAKGVSLEQIDNTKKSSILKVLSLLTTIFAWLIVAGDVLFFAREVFVEEELLAPLTYFAIYLAIGLFLLVLADSLTVVGQIRKSQLADTIVTEEEEGEQQLLQDEGAVLESDLKKLNFLIAKQQKAWVGAAHKDNIQQLLGGFINTKEQALHALDFYLTLYDTDLLEDLKNLTSSYDGKREYLEPFIKHGVVEAEYPHNVKV